MSPLFDLLPLDLQLQAMDLLEHALGVRGDLYALADAGLLTAVAFILLASTLGGGLEVACA